MSNRRLKQVARRPDPEPGTASPDGRASFGPFGSIVFFLWLAVMGIGCIVGGVQGYAQGRMSVPRGHGQMAYGADARGMGVAIVVLGVLLCAGAVVFAAQQLRRQRRKE